MTAENCLDIKRYLPNVDEKAVSGIVKHLGIALRSPSSSLVSCSSKDELARVRDSWLKQKLALAGDDAALDKAIDEVCTAMHGDARKARVTFYYLLAEKFGRLDTLS